MASEESKSLDRILDQALRSYAAQEPRAGLEKRVLARMGSRRRGWRWVAALAAATATAAMVLWVREPAPVAHPPSGGPAVVARMERVEPATPPVPVRAPVAAPRQKRAKPPLPRREVFPSASPMTAEERALVRLALRAAEERAAVRPPERLELEPVRISSIVIERLPETP
jgi:hypothetical protein